jgi:hypothetical protein
VPCVPGKTVAENLLKELATLRITTHNLIDVGAEAFGVSGRVIYDRGYFCEKIRTAVLGEIPSIDMQSAIFTVKGINVGIEITE